MGIDEAHDNGLKVAIAYPNPGKDVKNYTALQNAHAEIYDLTWKLVRTQEITKTITSINVESWPSGTYLWKVMREGKVMESCKWIKVK